MRRKGKGKDSDATPNKNAKPDIRMLTLHFLLSFLRFSSSIKSSFLEEQHQREALLSIFKGLSGDPLSVVRETLEVLWADVWCDVKVRRTLKVGVFGEGTMKHVSINFSLSFAFR